MNFLNKIKNKYHSKIFESLINSKNYIELKKELLLLRSQNLPLYMQCLHQSINATISRFEYENFHIPKSLWVTGFYHKDNEIVSKFIKYYLQETGISANETKFSDNIDKINKQYEINYDSSLERFIYLNYAFQYIIAQDSNFDIDIIQSNFAFYDYQSSIYLAHSAFLKLYIYVVRNPISLFLTLKKNWNGNSHLAFNYLFNLDNKNHLTKIQNENQSIHEYRQSWEVNLQSWTNINTINTFKGFIVKIEDLEQDPVQFFTDIIAHISVSEIKIKFDYKLISQFLETEDYINYNMKLHDESSMKISKNDMKFLKNNLSGAYKEFYQID